jgi:uncharacterized membrane protein YgaE (UPF0421/DUF939 family)
LAKVKKIKIPIENFRHKSEEFIQNELYNELFKYTKKEMVEATARMLKFFKIMEQQKAQWEHEKQVQLNIIQNTLNDRDVLIQQYLAENNELKEEIRQLKENGS